MRNHRLGPSLAFAVAVALASLGARAQEAPAAECFPKCRSGFLCHEGACVSSCNPVCADDERCTAEGECVLKAPAGATPEPAPAPEAQKPPYRPKGGVLGLTAGALLCASAESWGCHTTDGDTGVYAGLRGGYLFLSWLEADLDLSFSPLFMKDDPLVDKALLFAASLGARFLPLARRHLVDPVLGLHVGYFFSWTKNQESENTTVASASMHAVHLAYTVGLDFNVAPAFSLGVALDVFEPFWVAECTEFAYQSGNTATGVPEQEATKQCATISADSFPFYFGLGVAGTFFI
ncbi:MAG: hypothetical protein M0R80_06480 [Proteobacteria bacterium]|jgi:hypothetical protein|nr:hypothetical protein [Pseudomonadota bacterium]